MPRPARTRGQSGGRRPAPHRGQPAFEPRRLPHSRWGCRSNTTGALLCLADHPEHRRSGAARRALELLLARETREHPGFEVTRLVGPEPRRGVFTHFGRFDPGLVLDLCGRLGLGRDDERVGDLVAAVEVRRGPHGLWSFPAHPAAGRWITLDLLRSLRRLGGGGDWLTLTPRTPFQACPKRRGRF